jgi:hypothetical protein
LKNRPIKDWFRSLIPILRSPRSPQSHDRTGIGQNLSASSGQFELSSNLRRIRREQIHMPDLLSCEIDAIKLTDIDDFLAVTRPELERPPEGTRVDYKELLPPDIGDDVAALSNTQGGLIFVGVKASKIKQNIPVSRDGAELGNDAKARITNLILSTVQPRPVFEIAIFALSAPSKILALIRVQTGPFPPYEFRSGAAIRIPVRIQDTNRQATLREIEDLQRRRAAMSAPAENIVNKYVGSGARDLYLTRPMSGGETREEQFQLALVIPRVPISVRMDSAFHREFERLIKIVFTSDTQFSRNSPRGRFYQVEQRNFGTPILNRAWRMWTDGPVGLVASLTRRGTPGEWIGDVALDLLRLLTLASLCFEKWNCIGPVVVFHLLSAGPMKFLPQFPKLFDPENFHVAQHIHFPDTNLINRPVVESRFYHETDVTSLASPQELTSEIMLTQLQ